MTDTLLRDYLDRASLAAQLNVSERTVARYESLPNGLPSTLIGGRKFYRIPAVRQWIEARETKPNPRRAA